MQNLASRLRHRITVEEPVYTADTGGGYSIAWNLKTDLWAEITTKKADANFAEDKIQKTERIIATIRYRDDITNKMRLKYEGSVFAIKNIINPNELDEILEIIADEEV